MRVSSSRSNPFSSMATLAFVLLLAYFCYHAVSGDRGLLALMKLSNQVEQSRQELDNVNFERLKLEHRVSLLRDESLDLDLLDEQARKLLGYVGTDETVYTNSK